MHQSFPEPGLFIIIIPRTEEKTREFDLRGLQGCTLGKLQPGQAAALPQQLVPEESHGSELLLTAVGFAPWDVQPCLWKVGEALLLGSTDTIVRKPSA